jgi:hypothetical protein
MTTVPVVAPTISASVIAVVVSEKIRKLGGGASET